MHAIPKLTEEVGPRLSLSMRCVESFILCEDAEKLRKEAVE